MDTHDYTYTFLSWRGPILPKSPLFFLWPNTTSDKWDKLRSTVDVMLHPAGTQFRHATHVPYNHTTYTTSHGRLIRTKNENEISQEQVPYTGTEPEP